MFDSIHQSVLPLLDLPRKAKQLIVGTVDVSLCILTVWLAYYLRLGEFVYLVGMPAWAAFISVIMGLPIFIMAGLYKVVFRYSGWRAMISVVVALGTYTSCYATVIMAISIPGIPRTIGIIQPMLLLLTIASTRLIARYFFGGMFESLKHNAVMSRTVIYGAGAAGRLLAESLSQSFEMRVVAFLDDDTSLSGHVLNGVPIFSPLDLPLLIDSKSISHVLLAMPTVSRERRNQILLSVGKYPVAVKTLPNLVDIVDGKVAVSDLRELDIDDLLTRHPVEPDGALLGKNINNKVVLVTGAGGSIGSELCRQIVHLQPKKLIIVDLSEFALYQIHSELEALVRLSFTLVPVLASVQDQERMREIISTWSPDTLYHAAAYKHVPIVEHNMVEGIKNNVIGSLITAKLAIDAGVENFVLISTDKAVRPTNVMGATKRLAEMCVQALYANQKCDTLSNLCMVRFGNVLGSSGSVIPKFRQQIKDGGPVTVTHPNVNRYFMTIPEAAQLVIQAAAMAEGGDVFVLDMGGPVKIIDLAHRIVEMSGLEVKSPDNPEGDIEIAITGLRPGEKIYEELLIGDNPEPTQHPLVMKAQDEFLAWPVLIEEIQLLQQLLKENDVEGLAGILRRLVSGYHQSNGIVDWVYQQKQHLDQL